MQKIFKTSPQVKQINSELTKKFSGRKDNLVSMGKSLQAKIKDFQKNRSVMSAKKLNTLKENIGKQEIQLRRAQAKFQQELFVAQNKQMGSFVKRVKSIVGQVAAKKDLEVVLPKNIVLYSKGALDITPDVLNKLG